MQVDVRGLGCGDDPPPGHSADEGGPDQEQDPSLLPLFDSHDLESMTVREDRHQVEQNQEDGAAREVEAIGELLQEFPDADIETQRDLVDENGDVVVDLLPAREGASTLLRSIGVRASRALYGPWRLPA